MLSKTVKQRMAAALSIAVCASLTAGFAVNANAAAKKATWVLVKSSTVHKANNATETSSTTYKYDKNGWLKQREYKGYSTNEKTVFTRDKTGLEKTIKRYTDGKLDEITQNTIKKGKITKGVVYTFDDNHKKIKFETITYTYKKNKLKKVLTKWNNGMVSKDILYPNGNLKSSVLKDKGNTTTSKHNKKGDMVSTTSVYKQDGKVFSTYDITRSNKYDKKGNIVKIVEKAKNTDASGKVEKERTIYQYSYKYDKAGNIKQEVCKITHFYGDGTSSSTSRTTNNTYKKIMVTQ
jgi:hypothetical protein